MERGWDRTHPFRRLDARQIERLAGSARPGARVLEAVPLMSGLRNTNYRVSFGDGMAVVLRLYQADRSACAREAALLRMLAGRLPVPAVLDAQPEAEVPFTLLEWLEGDPLDEVLATVDAAAALEIAAACGAALAAIHETRFAVAGFLEPDLTVRRPMAAWSAAMLDEIDRAAPRLDPTMVGRLRRCVDDNAALLHGVWKEAALVHADFKPWNLLGATDEPGASERSALRWRLTGVLDWEFACAGCRLIDVGTFLRDLSSRPPGYGESFSGSYLRAGGELPAQWPRLTLLVDLVSLVQMAGRSAGRASADLHRLIAESLGSIER
jgi:Ser/Thr protein kinase RdoA (MazF antagonist)